MARTTDVNCCTSNMTDTETLQLPIDVIIHIMSYLSASDRMCAGLVSRMWREASLAMKFVDRQALVFRGERFENCRMTEVLNVLQHSTRPFYHFVFKRVELARNMHIWEQYGPRMRSLVLICCDLSEKTLVDILKCCNSLRVLHINACRECLMSGRLLENENDVKALSKTFQNLQELSLGYNGYLSDALFNRLVAICPNLESLSLIGCQISFHRGLYKKFYPANNVAFLHGSSSVLTFLNTFHYLKRQVLKIKQLDFSHTLIDEAALTTLSSLEELKLDSLLLQGCHQLTIAGIRELTRYQTSLKVLDVSCCSRITDASLVCICKNLTKLETLRIRRCRAITDNGAVHIKLLGNLKELDISEDELLTGNCMNVPEDYDAEGADPDENLELLTANALNFHEEAIEHISKSYPNLRSLEVSYCFTGVTDKTIQMIFKELVHLQTLKISHCDKVSDAGLTGMGAGKHENIEKDDDERIPELIESKLKISLRSRAEEEIARDADRKREVMKLCEDVSNCSYLKTFSGFSLIRLKRLRELDLSGCNRITDVSLKHAFGFPELRILNLSRCQQITHVGLYYLAKNNPAIEELNLDKCHNISDVGISYIAQGLHRLKRLYVQDCSQLTDHSLDSIKLHCKSLQYLNARCCQRMSTAGIASLTHLCVDWVTHVEDFAPGPPAPHFLSLRIA